MKRSFLIEDNVAHELTFRRLTGRLWPFLRIYPWRLWGVLGLVITYVLVGRVMPLLFGYAVDHGVRARNLEVIGYVAGAFLVCEILRSVLAFGQSYAIQKLGNQVLFDIRHALIRHVQSLTATYFDKTSSGRTMTRVTNDVHSLGELFSQGMTAIFVNLVEMSSIFIALMAVSLRLSLAVLMMAPPLLWLCHRLSKVIRIRFGAAKRKLAMINAFTAESIGGMKLLQLYGQGGASRQTFDTLSGDYKDLQLQTVRLFAMLWPVVEAFNIGTVAASLLLGATFREELGLSTGQIAAFLLLVQSFFAPLRAILEKYNQLQNSLASADRVFQMFDVTPEIKGGESIPTGRLKGDIEFRNVSFRYGPTAPFALDGVSLHVRPGESVALIGRTGSGKSTMIALAQKLYNPVSGEILVDGQPLQNLDPQAIRSRIGVVQQDNFIFRGTIASNISLSNATISRHQVETAAHRAHCQRLLDAHHGGLDARVEERGANLSVGERQLIAFARVLAFDPDILILDEATANVDSVHERLIQEATNQVMRGRTSLIIAHRLSTVLHCDRIVLLSHGKIIEQGSHSELMNRRGGYWELFMAQQNREGWIGVDDLTNPVDA